MGATTPDYGLNAPMAPTKPGHLASLPLPETSRPGVVYRALLTVTGFVPAPFNPPRA